MKSKPPKRKGEQFTNHDADMLPLLQIVPKTLIDFIRDDGARVRVYQSAVGLGDR